MNKVILMGRLTRDPEIRYSQGENAMALGRFTLAVNRRYAGKEDAQPSADFISCKAFKKTAEFLEKYCRKGTKLVVEGWWQTGSYTNKEGVTVYTNECIVERCEFAESKAASQDGGGGSQNPGEGNATAGDGFMNIPEGIDEELPFQ